MMTIHLELGPDGVYRPRQEPWYVRAWAWVKNAWARLKGLVQAANDYLSERPVRLLWTAASLMWAAAIVGYFYPHAVICGLAAVLVLSLIIKP